ncbi:MAG: hypothetical protein AO394_07540 [Candidatus Fermentibacter daniensis]|nr:MAG: hypothetical protein AO394_07540 [Candidatus Fermentibacter daniensis]
MRHSSLLQGLCTMLILTGAACSSEMPDFGGRWETTYGPMTLTQEGDRVTGLYVMGGTCTVEGRVNASGRLIFTYAEPSATGEGWFELSDDGTRISGQWRATGSTVWGSWEGSRSGGGVEGTKWLVILEAEWQTGMSEPEYSFGEMLATFFARVGNVRVRQRFIHDRSDLEKFALEAAALPGSVYMLLSCHATEDGIALADEILDGRAIAAALSPCRNLALLHFSSCLVMGGGIPGQIMSSRHDWNDGFIISGYTKSVDWAGSAIIEFIYLDCMLEKGMAPASAARAVLGTIDYAGEAPGGWMDAAGFTWIEPEGE